MMRSNKTRRGANAIEFALVMPVLLAMMSGVMDYGWYFHQQILVTSAVRDGVRSGAATPADSGSTPEEVAKASTLSALEEVGIDGEITIDAVRSGVSPDEVLTVTVAMSYDMLVGLVPLPETLGATMVMRIEDQTE